MATLLEADKKDLGGFSVARILPNPIKKMVGPFIFFDHMGPAEFKPGDGINVRPHPHIGLSTLSYLFEGSMLHRDSLGIVQEIHPGDVNWMTAGKGIVHSERQSLEVKGKTQRLNGIQSWLALPRHKTEIEPSFQHVSKHELPNIHRDKLHLRLIAGEAYGYVSPVRTHSPMFYLDILAQAGAIVDRPSIDPLGIDQAKTSTECAVYVQSGILTIGEQEILAGDFALLDDNETQIVSKSSSRFLLLGGSKFEQEPKLFWNFVAYDTERMEAAKRQWREGQFPIIPHDHEEFIPLP